VLSGAVDSGWDNDKETEDFYDWQHGLYDPAAHGLN
jgi:hypothetical protein